MARIKIYPRLAACKHEALRVYTWPHRLGTYEPVPEPSFTTPHHNCIMSRIRPLHAKNWQDFFFHISFEFIPPCTSSLSTASPQLQQRRQPSQRPPKKRISRYHVFTDPQVWARRYLIYRMKTSLQFPKTLRARDHLYCENLKYMCYDRITVMANYIIPQIKETLPKLYALRMHAHAIPSFASIRILETESHMRQAYLVDRCVLESDPNVLLVCWHDFYTGQDPGALVKLWLLKLAMRYNLKEHTLTFEKQKPAFRKPHVQGYSITLSVEELMMANNFLPVNVFITDPKLSLALGEMLMEAYAFRIHLRPTRVIVHSNGDLTLMFCRGLMLEILSRLNDHENGILRLDYDDVQQNPETAIDYAEPICSYCQHPFNPDPGYVLAQLDVKRARTLDNIMICYAKGIQIAMDWTDVITRDYFAFLKIVHIKNNIGGSKKSKTSYEIVQHRA